MGVIAEYNNKVFFFIKGAPEIIIELCELSLELKTDVLKVLKSYESKGNRVIASAWIEITDEFE